MPFAMLMNNNAVDKVTSIFNKIFYSESYIKKRRIEILEETVKAYNSKTRNLINGRCVYRPSDVAEGCAIGRLIKDKKLCEHLDKIGPGTYSSVGSDKVFKQLPNNLKILGKNFLYDLQFLHDITTFWNETGLTEFGVNKVNEIKETYKL